MPPMGRRHVQGFYDWTPTTPFADNLGYNFDGEGRPNGLLDITTSSGALVLHQL